MRVIARVRVFCGDFHYVRYESAAALCSGGDGKFIMRLQRLRKSLWKDKFLYDKTQSKELCAFVCHEAAI